MPELNNLEISAETARNRMVDETRELSVVELHNLEQDILRWETNFTLQGLANAHKVTLEQVQLAYDNLKNKR